MMRPATTNPLNRGCFTHQGTSDPRSPNSPISFRADKTETEGEREKRVKQTRRHQEHHINFQREPAVRYQCVRRCACTHANKEEEKHKKYRPLNRPNQSSLLLLLLLRRAGIVVLLEQGHTAPENAHEADLPSVLHSCNPPQPSLVRPSLRPLTTPRHATNNVGEALSFSSHQLSSPASGEAREGRGGRAG